jgi:hypothetical protein
MVLANRYNKAAKTLYINIQLDLNKSKQTLSTITKNHLISLTSSSISNILTSLNLYFKQ